MFARFLSTNGHVGVDIGTRGIKMLQVREPNASRAGNHAECRLEVIGAASVDVPLSHFSRRSDPKLPGIAKPGASQGGVTGDADRSDRHSIGGHASAIDGSQTNSSGWTEQLGEANGSAPATAADLKQLSEQIRSAFVEGGFTGRRCVVSLPREDVHVQSVRLPSMPDAELRQTVTWEAAQRFGLERTAMEVDFIRTGATLASGENRDEVILIAASHAAIHARVDPLLAAGLQPIAVDTGFTALIRTFSRRVRRESDLNLVRAVVEVGASGSTVMILRGDQVAFCKPLSISGAMFDRAVAENLQMTEQDARDLRRKRLATSCTRMRSGAGPGVSNVDCCGSGRDGEGLLDPATDRAVYAAVRPIMSELAKEITLCLRYYGVTFRGHPPERIVLTGGDALEPHLDETISKTCKMQTSFDDTPSSLSGMIGAIQTCLNRAPGPAACWAVALGLSLRNIDGRVNAKMRPDQAQSVAPGVTRPEVARPAA